MDIVRIGLLVVGVVGVLLRRLGVPPWAAPAGMVGVGLTIGSSQSRPTC